MWSPSTPLIATINEFQTFSYNIQYYEETIGAPTVHLDGTTTPGTTTRTGYPVVISQISPQPTISVSSSASDPATISGYFKYIFYDTITYRDFNENIKTLQGNGNTGSWEMLDMNDCYQFVEFTPDTSRYRRFSFTATANNSDGSARSTMTYFIDVSDQNWSSGAGKLKEAIDTIRSRGV